MAGEAGKEAAVDPRDLQNKDDAKRRLFPLALLDLVEDGVSDALHQAVGSLGSDSALDDQDLQLLQLVAVSAIKEVVDLLRKLLLGGDLLKRDQVNAVLALVQLLANRRLPAFRQKPGEGGDLHQDGLVGVAPDHLGQTLLLKAVKNLRDLPLLFVVQISLRQPAKVTEFVTR